MKLRAVAAALFRRASCWVRGRVAVVSSARQRGVKVFLARVAIAILAAGCATQQFVSYRACFHLTRPNKPSAIRHIPGWITNQQPDGRPEFTRFIFLADGTSTPIAITCIRCVSVTCPHVNAASGNVALAHLERNRR